MKVNVISAPDVNAAFRALTYTPLNADSQAYIQNSMHNLSNAVTGTATDFLHNSNVVYQNLSSDAAIASAKALLSTVSNQISVDSIYAVPYDGFKTMNYAMEHYAMLEPSIRRRYTNQEIDGFSSYHEREPDVEATESLEFRDIVSGVNTNRYDGTIYNHGAKDKFNQLDFHDKKSIITTWERLRNTLKDDDDIFS